MKVKNIHYRSVWADYQLKEVYIINQVLLPFRFEIKTLKSIDEIIHSIKQLEVRGAPALGLIASYAVWLSYALNNGNLEQINQDYCRLIESRPTAVNLKKGANAVFSELNKKLSELEVYNLTQQFVNNELNALHQIGIHGKKLIEELYKKKQKTVNILTHCNAGWLACGDYGTALAPIFEAHRNRIPIHVWVDETRPLNQGARLTAWELYHENIPFHIIADNTGGQLMQQNLVDMVLVGADRITLNGDVANKIGTYLKALSAKENSIPFIVAAPLSTFDFELKTGKEIVIEERLPNELFDIIVQNQQELVKGKIFPEEFPAYNLAFDITPAKFIDAYVTEKGIFRSIKELNHE